MEKNKTGLFSQEFKDFLYFYLVCDLPMTILKVIAVIIIGSILLFLALGLLGFLTWGISTIISVPVELINSIFDTTWALPMDLFENFMLKVLTGSEAVSSSAGSGYTGGAHPIIAGGNIIMMP